MSLGFFTDHVYLGVVTQIVVPYCPKTVVLVVVIEVLIHCFGFTVKWETGAKLVLTLLSAPLPFS